MMDVTARVRRRDGWWAVEVPEIPGLFTQAKRLDQIPSMVRDAAGMLGVKVEDVSVESILDEADTAVPSRRNCETMVRRQPLP